MTILWQWHHYDVTTTWQWRHYDVTTTWQGLTCICLMNVDFPEPSAPSKRSSNSKSGLKGLRENFLWNVFRLISRSFILLFLLVIMQSVAARHRLKSAWKPMENLTENPNTRTIVNHRPRTQTENKDDISEEMFPQPSRWSRKSWGFVRRICGPANSQLWEEKECRRCWRTPSV